MSEAQQLEEQVRRLAQAGDVRQAAELCDRLNQQFPEYEPGWYSASRLALLINEPLIAVRAIDRALQLSPGRPEWLYQRTESLIAAGEIEAAQETAKAISGLRFASADASAAVGQTMVKLGNYDVARSQFRNAAEIAPENSGHHYNLATVERFLGNRIAANEAVNRCLELNPDDVDAHLLRAGLGKQVKDSNHVAELEAAHARMSDDPKRRLRLCFALSKELEDLEDYDRSFEYLAEGASLRRAGMQYTPGNDIDTLRTIREVYDESMFDGSIAGHVNAEPIFVIGMPRTGTTLVERILGSHSVVESAGELQTFSVQLAKYARAVEGPEIKRAADLVPRSARIDFDALGESYIAATRPQTGKTAHFVDKLPLNFLYAGLIHLALPKAKIVLLERDPMDTCYAVFKTLFEGIYPFSYDLEELANYFVEYKKLVDHWLSVIPDAIHVVQYERLVTDPRPVVEDLLDYCGLSFEPACLEFHKSEAASTTASAVQVREGLYQSSIGKWRNYERQLEPVKRILDSA